MDKLEELTERLDSLEGRAERWLEAAAEVLQVIRSIKAEVKTLTEEQAPVRTRRPAQMEEDQTELFLDWTPPLEPTPR